MHELAISRSLLDLALRHAADRGGGCVTELRVVVGDLESLAEATLRSAWDEVSRGTACEGARLAIERVPARFTCMDCRSKFTLTGVLTPCPRCGGRDARLVTGDEFRLDAIVLERAGPATEARK
jgi:hydrogenase nickel incorporation protein HypA/HybF